MNEPNPSLLQRYDTRGFYEQSLVKHAELPFLLQLLGPLGTLALMRSQGNREAQQEQEAAVLTELLRASAEERMAGRAESLSGANPAMTAIGRAVQMAGPLRDQQEMIQSLNKEGSGKVVRRMGELVTGSRARGYEKAVKRLSADGAPAPLQDAASRWAGSERAKVTATRAGVLGTTAAGAASLRKEAFGVPLLAGKLLGSAGKALGSAGRGLGGSIGGAVRQKGIGLQQTGQQWMRHQAGATGRLQSAAAKAGVGPTVTRPGGLPGRVGAPGLRGPVQPAVTSGSRSQPLLGWKSKALLGATGVGTMYAGYKGLQATKDYMMQPTYASPVWGGQGTLKY